MSPWGAFGFALALLVSPWLLMPRRRPAEIWGPYHGYWLVNALYCAFWHRLEVEGPDPLPAEGPAILISNHTCCIDHMLLQSSTRRLLRFLIAKELYDFWFFRPFCQLGGCIPVKRDGKDVGATRTALRLLGEGKVVPIFPEGRIYPTSGRVLGPAKPGVAFIALRAGVPVIPAYICGTPATNKVVRSYLTPSHSRVRFGPPIDLSDLVVDGKVDRDAFDEVTRRLMGAIQALRDQAQGVAGEAARRDPGGVPLGDGVGGDGQRPDRGAEALPVGRAAVEPA
jgi:1-acyl-sn-glycerol-3-phosphate acyltransferase